MFKKIFEYAGADKKLIYSSTFLLMISVAMGVLPFIFVYQIISPLLSNVALDIAYIIPRAVGIFSCLASQAIFYVFGLRASHKAAYNILLSIRISLQKRFEKLPMGVIHNKGVGGIKKLFVDDVDGLEVLVAHSLPEGIANLMIPIATYIAMFFIDYKLALLSLTSIPLGFVMMMIMYGVGMKRMGSYYAASQKMNSTIIEYINGMEVVKVFGKDAQSYEKYKNDISNYRDMALDWYKAARPWSAAYNSLLPCTILLTLPFGSFFVIQEMSTLADLVLILCLSIGVGTPMLKSLGFLPTLPQLNYKISALEQMLSSAELKQSNAPFRGENFDVRFNDVCFRYDTDQSKEDTPKENEQAEEINYVVTNINFIAKQGEKTALVGESGSGKSTLAKLLVHHYDPMQGSIWVGNQNIQDMSLSALNEHISYVSQEQYLFNMSLLENIRIGKLNATDEEVIEAARKAQCMDFIERLPNGIHSMAGDAGKMLSGGERQRISFARAILKDAPIVVLDEATAFTDPENEDKLENAISEIVKGKTLIVIAHKLGTIVDADKICVFSNGAMVDSGNHGELLTSCDEYKKLWSASQSSATWGVNVVKEDAVND